MEKKTDATADMVDDLQTKTKEFLQPNPAARAKMVAIKLSSGSQAKAQYPQTEGILGNAMAGHGKKLGEDDPLGQALIEAGESLKQIADVKYSLDNNVKQNFLEPLQHLQNNDIKEVLVSHTTLKKNIAHNEFINICHLNKFTFSIIERNFQIVVWTTMERDGNN